MNSLATDSNRLPHWGPTGDQRATTEGVVDVVQPKDALQRLGIYVTLNPYATVAAKLDLNWAAARCAGEEGGCDAHTNTGAGADVISTGTRAGIASRPKLVYGLGYLQGIWDFLVIQRPSREAMQR